MTQLALAVDADDEMWTLDSLPTPEAPYVEVGDELVEVRSRFPSSYYTLTGETLPPRIRVRRAVGGTTAASHNSGSTLTPTYGLGSGGGGGSLTVDNQSDEPEEVSTLIVGAVFGPEGTAAVTGISDDDSVSGASASVAVSAPEDDGSAEISLQALASLDQGGSVLATAGADEGAALARILAESASGTATARLDAASASGDAESRVAVISGATILAGVVASHVDGVGDSLVITAGDGLPGDPGFVLTADATVGSQWLAPADPLTSDGAIVISAADETNVLTLGADGSFEISGSGVVRMISLPSADPEVAGQLYTDGVPSAGVPQALMVSGGPA